MKRTTSLAYLGSLVLLSHAVLGCVSEYSAPDPPATPDASVFVADARPARSLIVAPSRDELIARWQLPSTSPWLPYEKLTLPSVLGDTPQSLWMPQLDGLDEVKMARMAAERVAQNGLPNDAAWFVDLSGAASIAFASALGHYARQSVAAVPTFNNWPADNELVPAEETLTAMISSPPRLPEPDDVGARPVFLLDSWRLAFKDEMIDEGVIDNRYMLTLADFPTPEVLQEQGISQIMYVVNGDQVLDEEDDLHELFASYEAAGIAIYLIDLESIIRARDTWEPTWWVEAHARYFHVRRRITVIHDPGFYLRARGGFGGAHMMPVPSGHMHMGFHAGGG